MKTRVFARMKPKTASLGFSKEELEAIAAVIAGNLDSDDTTEEDIDALIDAALPLLRVAQKAANRIIEKARKKATLPKATEGSEKEPNLSGATTPPTSDEEPDWFKNYRETQEKRLAAIENDRVSTSRCSQLEAIIKDTETFEAKTHKDLARMSSDSDELSQKSRCRDLNSFLNKL